MLKIIHLELSEANGLVSELHRHHKPVRGHRFSIGAVSNGRLVGAVICGRPVARETDQKCVIEVTRLVSDGTKNVCSFLYAAAARAAKELGYHKIQTFILETETGVTLCASGWKRVEGFTRGGNRWQSRQGRRNDQPDGPKIKFFKDLQ